MAGILDLDPQTQGLLAAAFASLQASGPSRMPVSFGQVLGQAGTAGMHEAQVAEKQKAEAAAKDIALRKAKLDMQMQEQLQAGGMLGDMADPDRLEALGQRMSIQGHPGGAALVSTAQKIREKKAAAAQLATMKSVAGVQPDPQEFEQAADQGTPQPMAKPGRPGIFGSLAASEIPQVAAQAKALQSSLDAQPAGSSISPQHWMDAQKTLAAQEATLAARESNQGKSEHVIQDKASPTGWSYEDTRTKKRTVGAPPPSAANALSPGGAIPDAHKDLHGDDYLATLPGGMANVVRSIVQGKTSLNDASMRYGNRDAMKERVLQADPTWQGNRFKNRQEFENPNGKTQTNITAMNTVIAHMGTVDELTDALKNNKPQVVNALVNRARTEFGKPEVNNAEVAIQAMGSELMRVFRQVGASEHEAQAWERKFNAAKGSPEQLKGALQVGVELLRGRLDAVNDTWKRSMGVDTDYPNILSPKSQAVLQRLNGGGKPSGTTGPFDDPEKERKYQEWKAKQGK